MKRPSAKTTAPLRVVQWGLPPTQYAPLDDAGDHYAIEGAARWTRDDWQWLLVAMAVPVMLLASRLELDFWYDEVYTLHDFASQPVRKIVTDYSAPNNHILYTLLLHVFAQYSDSELVLRFPSFLCAIGTLVALFALARRLAGREVAIFAVLALGLNQMFLIHAVQLRGYGLSMFLVTLLAERASAAAKRAAFGLDAGQRAAAVIAVASAAFLYTIPTNLMFVLPLAAWSLAIVCRASGSLRATFVSAIGWTVGCLLAALLYAPIADEVRAAVGVRHPVSLDGLVRLAREVFWAAGHDFWPLWCVLPLGLFGWRGRKSLFGPLDVLSLVLAMCGVPVVLFALSGTTPFVRTFCPMLPFLALATGWLLFGLVRLIERVFSANFGAVARSVAGAIVLLVVLLPAILSYPSRLRKVREQIAAQDGYFNYYAADFRPSDIARFLRGDIAERSNYLVCYEDAEHFNLIHYLAQAGFSLPPRRLVKDENGHLAARIYVVADPRTKFDDLSRQCGLPARLLASFALVYDGGYFRVYRSPGDVELKAAEGS